MTNYGEIISGPRDLFVSYLLTIKSEVTGESSMNKILRVLLAPTISLIFGRDGDTVGAFYAYVKKR